MVIFTMLILPPILNQEEIENMNEPLIRNEVESVILKLLTGASLVAQWLRVYLPMRGMRVRALVWEDPTCRRAAGPMSHNY